MAGTRRSDINQEEVPGGLVEPGAESDGTADAKEPRSAKKRAAKKAAKKTVKKKATKKAKKKATKKAKKKALGEQQARAAPKKRARAKKAGPEDAPVAPAPEEPVELSPEEALALLTQMGSGGDDQKTADAPAEGASEPDAAPEGASGDDVASDDSSDDAPVDMDASDITDTPAPAEVTCDSPEPAPEPVKTEDPGILASILGASCRVLTFESESVDEEMCVARVAVEHLQRMVIQCGLGISIGPICRTPGEFLSEWDNTPSSMPVAIVANLSCAGTFLPAVVDERPRVASAYWIVFETLRSQLSTATSAFLSELRSRHRLRAIGFGPRNMMTAARGGAEAVRGHVEWGFGRGPVSVAG